MASMPPNMKFGGPPPGATPVGLSSMKMSPMQGIGGAPTGDSEASGGGAGIAKMFYAIENSLDTLASAIPEQAEEIDKIKSALREVLSSAVSGGAAFMGRDEQTPSIRSGPTEPLI